MLILFILLLIPLCIFTKNQIEKSKREQENEEEVKVYVVVGKDFEEGKENFQWLLQKISGEKKLKIFITHVHIPSKMIPFGQTMLPANEVSEQEVKEYRNHETYIMHKCLDEYEAECMRHEMQAERLVIEADDAATGLLQLIAMHRIDKLLIGPHLFPPSVEKSKPQSTSNTEENGLVVEVSDRLRDALAEIENLKERVHNESQKNKELKIDANEAIKRAVEAENLLAREGTAANESKNTYDIIVEQLQTANKQKQVLEDRVANDSGIIKNLKNKLTTARFLIRILHKQHERLKLQNNVAVRTKEVEELCRKNNVASTSTTQDPGIFSEFSRSEIEQATNNFNNLLKIGQGEYGSVYKGFLQNMVVAIKKLNPKSTLGKKAFRKEVAILGMVMHDNILSLKGACADEYALIYEFLPNESLADRLNCKNNTPPLTWRARTRISVEICRSLLFLHSNKPHAIFHGNLKPENILLDANLVSKLGDFGIYRLLLQSNPKTKKFTPYSDICSFGIVILQLITGEQPFGIVHKVKEALDNDQFYAMVDRSAGPWPYVHARKLVELGLRCCDESPNNRPDLTREFWDVLKPMLKADSLPIWMPRYGSNMDYRVPIPDCFICPLSTDIMEDPRIAADGFTYEAKSIRDWFYKSNRNSPVTNEPFPNFVLIPNRSLRSEIKQWLLNHEKA